MTPDIFLSYNREDVAVAQAYRDAFAREGLDVWWDATLRSGETYDEVTEAALRGAKAVVVLWSPRSVASRWVRAEATIAERNKTLMPVTIELCDRPVMFELTQTADLAHWKGEAEDKAWLAFLGDVRRRVGRGGPEPVESAAPAPASAPDRGGAPIVAVLPLAHRADDDALEVLAEDLTEEITRELAQSPFVKVIAVGTMAAWRDKPVDYRALGREFEARYLIEGKLQHAGEDVRLTFQLIDAETASMVWSPRFVGKAADMAASPEEMPVAVATQLGEHIAEIEMKRAMAKPGPFSGWERLLRAIAYGTRPGTDSANRAIEEARKAVVAAPDLGLAHAVLATTLAVRANTYGEGIDDALSREIHAHATRAMQLDGDSPMVIARLAPTYAAIGDGETCLRLARRAVELYPHAAHAHFALGMAYSAVGRIADAIAALEEQDRLTPHDLQRPARLMLLGACYWIEGQTGEADAAIDRALALHPNWDLALMWKAILAAHRGEEEAGRDIIKRLRAADPTRSIDQILRQMFEGFMQLRERFAVAAAILRRLWDETGGDT
jgi:TolB-like protein/Flp pilus assembly protein TadD